MTLRLHEARRRRALAATLASALLAACGGGSDDDDDRGTAQLRLINAAIIDSIDLTVDSGASGETQFFSAIAHDAQSDFVALRSGTYTLRSKRAGASTALALNASLLEPDKHYTAFFYGREGDYGLYAALEDQPEPASGRALLRVFNSAPDAGNVDVYLTESDASLDNVTPTVANVAAAMLSDYIQVDRGTWRLRVTGRGDPRDVRLDVAAFELADRARTTLALQPGLSGVLVHALVSQYQGALATLRNTQARVRLAAGVGSGAAVSASVGGVSLGVNLQSPSISSYVLVPAGVHRPEVSVNGVPITVFSRTFSAGQDHTLAVYGEATAPEWRPVRDRNLLPDRPDRAHIRLLHMAPDLDDRVFMLRDGVVIESDVFFANTNLNAQVNTGAAVRLEASSSLYPNPLFLDEKANLAGRGVYTLFVMTGATRPVGVLRRDR